MSEGMFLGRTPKGSDYHLDAAKLRTHGVIVGMTGSGKTGMALVALEELVRLGVPILAIDPKGDLGNLGLLFRDLAPDQFAPWTDGRDPEVTAARWRDGLAGWGLGAEDVAALADKLDLTMYTPGSEAGVPIDVTATLRRPSDAQMALAETRRDLVSDTVSGLLGLVGRSSDPIRDPAHIVLATLVESVWQDGHDLDLEGLILAVVDPPFDKVGVFPLDRFFPPDDRMDLAMQLNAVIAAPSFAAWTKGAALDLDVMLQRGAKSRVSIFCLQHLTEAERGFFLALLLGRLLAWTRAQPGTEQLRAALFFDEVAGWLPPHPADPPSKRPLLMLMKQARASGTGILLATQNPVDLDYKALGNAGLWCVGRLRTRQDRDRVLKGIGDPSLDGVIADLEPRQFLIARANGDTDVVASRHAMCFLRGPLTRAEISTLASGSAAPTASRSVHAAPRPHTRAAPKPDDGLLPAAPPLKSTQRLLDPRVVFSNRLGGAFSEHAEAPRDDGATVFRPALFATLSLRFDEDRVGFVVDTVQHRVWFPLGRDLPDTHIELALEERDLADDAPEGARFAPLPTWMDEDKELTALRKSVVDDVYRHETEGMFVHKKLKLYGKHGESEADFRARCQAVIEDRIDDDIAKLEKRFRKKTDTLQDRIRRQESKLLELRSKASSLQTEELLNVGETVLAWFSGRRRSLSTAASKRRQVTTANARLHSSEDELTHLMGRVDDLAIELQDAVDAIREEHEEALDAIEQAEVRLERNDIHVEAFGVLWVPVTRRI